MYFELYRPRTSKIYVLTEHFIQSHFVTSQLRVDPRTILFWTITFYDPKKFTFFLMNLLIFWWIADFSLFKTIAEFQNLLCFDLGHCNLTLSKGSFDYFQAWTKNRHVLNYVLTQVSLLNWVYEGNPYRRLHPKEQIGDKWEIERFSGLIQ